MTACSSRLTFYIFICSLILSDFRVSLFVSCGSNRTWTAPILVNDEFR